MDVSLRLRQLKQQRDTEYLDGLYLREKQQYLDPSENLVQELSLLDASLDKLFSLVNEEFPNHQSMHKFRLRVSRRIVSFSSILRRLSSQYESLPPTHYDRVKLHALHEFYQDHLMRHKSRLSEWWSRNERLYHSLCLSSFVSQATPTLESRQFDSDSYGGSDSNPDNGEYILTSKLEATRNMMLTQLDQMNATESSLLKSSGYISQQQQFLKDLKMRFNSASILFSSVRKRTIRHFGAVRCSFWLFLASCTFITLRRFKIFKLIHLALKIALYPLRSATETIFCRFRQLRKLPNRNILI